METITHGEEIELNDLKGAMVETVVCSYQVSGDEPFYKELIASIVFSPKDYKPHVRISVIVNGNETPFGTDTKQAIEFYNQQ